MANEPILSFRQLDAWRVSMDLVPLVYAVAFKLPASERFELSSQMRRAAVSIPSNIAEGHVKGALGRCIHHLRIALGSWGEVQTQIEVAERLGYAKRSEHEECWQHIDRVGQLLHGLLRAKQAQRLRSVASGVAFLCTCTAVTFLLSALR
jgi:four helix bundle protein